MHQTYDRVDFAVRLMFKWVPQGNVQSHLIALIKADRYQQLPIDRSNFKVPSYQTGIFPTTYGAVWFPVFCPVSKGHMICVSQIFMNLISLHKLAKVPKWTFTVDRFIHIPRFTKPWDFCSYSFRSILFFSIIVWSPVSFPHDVASFRHLLPMFINSLA